MTTMHHAGVCVADLDESLRFYRDGLGLTVLVDKALQADLEGLLGVRTQAVRTVFLGDAAHPDSGIIELLDLGVPAITASPPQRGVPARGVFLLSVQVDVPAVLDRLAHMGLGGVPRTMPTPGGGMAATVSDPDGVMVELLPMGRLAVMAD
ncbi:MAG: VOC family protein [Mycobacterium sp.]|nr:VOC family protein [Mycobacterium sp.]